VKEVHILSSLPVERQIRDISSARKTFHIEKFVEALQIVAWSQILTTAKAAQCNIDLEANEKQHTQLIDLCKGITVRNIPKTAKLRSIGAAIKILL